MAEEYAAVDESTILRIAGPTPGTRDVLTDLLRDDAWRLLAEVLGWIDAHAHL